MSRETERLFKGLDEFLEKNGGAESEEELNDLLQKYMEEYNNSTIPRGELTEANARTADDYLELAEEAETEREALRLAKKALKLEPDNLDAELVILENSSKDPMNTLKKLERLKAKGDKWIEENDYLEDVGHFWGIHQTRPYMRVRQTYLAFLVEFGMIEPAIAEAKDIIRLNENDNLGVRYELMHMYALLGWEAEALELLERYDEDSAMMLMPLSVLYYRKYDFKNALIYLKRIMKRNPDLKRFLKSVATGEEPEVDDLYQGMYRPFSMGELFACVLENKFLYDCTHMFFIWAYDELVASRSKALKSSSKPKKRKK